MKRLRAQTTVALLALALALAGSPAHANDSGIEDRIEALEEQQSYEAAMAAGDAARACGSHCSPVPEEVQAELDEGAYREWLTHSDPFAGGPNE